MEINTRHGRAGRGSGQAYRSRVVWGPVLPQDRSRLVQDESRLVIAGIHSRRTAAGLLGIADPDVEWARWQEESATVADQDN